MSDLLDVFRERLSRLRADLAADQLPGRVDDVFLRLSQLLGLLTGRAVLLLLLLLLPARLLLALAEDFLKVSHFGEVHVAGSASQLAIGTDVFRPEKVRQQLIRIGIEFFEFDRIDEFVFLLCGRVLAQNDVHCGLARHRETDPHPFDTEVIPGGGFHIEFFQRRDLCVFGRLDEFQRRRLIRNDVDRDVGLLDVAAVGLVNQFQLQASRLRGGDRRLINRPFARRGHESERLAVLFGERRRLHELVELTGQRHLCPFDDRNRADVLDDSLFETCVARIDQASVRAFESRVLEDRDTKRRRGLPAKFHTIVERLRHRRHSASEDWIFKAACHL